MKLKASYFILLFAIIFTTAASAQVDRRVGQGQYKRNPPKHDKVDFAEDSVNYLEKELTLDLFQKAAIKNIFADEKDNITAIGDNKDMTSMEKTDKFREVTQRIQKKVLPLLSKEQAEKYIKIEEARKF